MGKRKRKLVGEGKRGTCNYEENTGCPVLPRPARRPRKICFCPWRRWRRNYLFPLSLPKKNLHRLSPYIIRKRRIQKKNVFACPVEYFRGCLSPLSIRSTPNFVGTVKVLRYRVLCDRKLYKISDTKFRATSVISLKDFHEIKN